MATSGNVQNMLFCIKFKYVLAFNGSFSKIWFLIWLLMNSQTSAELTANKLQNLITKQGPGGAYNTDLHELQKNCHLNHIFQINAFYEISVYTKLNVCEDLEFIIQTFFSIRP